ncbi:heterokaryon incompatibility protein-domain-containing protein [Xylaria grammica]|nr:heterokaryon incompatibility protein-domain-containing protein [Xylaria grammica]
MHWFMCCVYPEETFEESRICVFRKLQSQFDSLEGIRCLLGPLCTVPVMSIVAAHSCCFCRTLVIDINEQPQIPLRDDELLFPLDLKDVQAARSGGCMFICKLIESQLWSFEFDQISTDWFGKEDQLQLYARVGRSGDGRCLEAFRGIGFRNKADLKEISWWNTSFRVFTTADNPAQGSVTTRPINEHPGSEENIGGMRRFLQACLERQIPHAHCTQPSDSYRPTRLLFIKCRASGDKAPEVSLCYPNGKTPYAALSYCWGGDQLHKTTRANAESRGSGISWGEIPQTIRDAIRVTTGVGLSYLWVDSFCIIQDDEQGKLGEIAQMPRIYGHATVTIVASRCKGASEGFLHDIDPAELTAFTCEVPYRCPTGELGTVYLVEDGERHSMSEPIDDRGWTLQESYLSSRLITFESRQSSIVCQCSSERPSFSDGWRQKSSQQTMHEVTFAIRAGNRGITPSQSDAREHREMNGALLREWQSCLFDYTKRKLTEPTDRCLAISGLAEVIAPGLGGGYLAGLWERSLPLGLLWSISGWTELRPRPKDYQGPSWSWTSVNGLVENRITIQDFNGNLLEVIECQVELSDPLAQFGAVKNGQLRVKGRLVRAEWTVHGLKAATAGGGESKILVPPENEILFYSPDTRDMENLSYNLGALEDYYQGQESPRRLSTDACTSTTNESNRIGTEPQPNVHICVSLLEVGRLTCTASEGPVGLVLSELPNNESVPYRRFTRIGLFDFTIGSQVAASGGASPEEWEKLIHDQKTCFDRCVPEVVQIE